MAVIAVRDDYRDLLQLVGTDDNAIQHNGGSANTMVLSDGSRLKTFYNQNFNRDLAVSRGLYIVLFSRLYISNKIIQIVFRL
jgi:hypothetical protein